MLTNEQIEEARKLQLFMNLEPDKFLELAQECSVQDVAADEIILAEGQAAEFLHIILNGKVEIFSTYRDRETTVSVQGSGQSFILAAVMLDRIYLKSARAITPCRILVVPAGLVRKAFQEDANMARAIAMELSIAYRGLVKEIKNQKLRSSLERLSNWLLLQYQEAGNQHAFKLPFSKRILASRLGMVPEVLSRCFASLTPHCIEVRGAGIEIKDLAALSRLAGSTATMDDPNT